MRRRWTRRSTPSGRRSKDERGWTLYPPGEVITPATFVDDVPTTFWYDAKPYEPANHLNKIYGLISVRYALRRSINIAAVKLAEMAGYERVAEMARRANLGDAIEATPSLALGSYEATPLQIAGAYTALVNGGTMKRPYFVRQVRDAQGRELYRRTPEDVEVMDPRVAFMVTELLQDVMLRGTGAGARYTYKFEEPAAGKTGTDDDGWFAGFTNNLLCVVWVGFDDNTDIAIEGARSALPIWAEFMKRAHAVRPYRNPPPFEAPEGVVRVELDPDTLELATGGCPNPQTEYFIAGSQPTRFCGLHSGGFTLATSVAGWDAAPHGAEPLLSPVSAPAIRPTPAVAIGTSSAPVIVPLPAGKTGDPADSGAREPKKSGVFKMVFGIFKK